MEMELNICSKMTQIYSTSVCTDLMTENFTQVKFSNDLISGTGNFKEVGNAKGEGYSVNVPFNSPGKGDAEYISCFEQILLPIASQFNPELILVSAGFGMNNKFF